MTENTSNTDKLIVVEKLKESPQLIVEYNQLLSHWKNNLKNLQEYYYGQHSDSAAPDVKEVLASRKLLGGFIQIRLDWIESAVREESLKSRYLNVLPPFPQKDGLSKMILHFFQTKETEDKNNILYEEKDSVERELCILWDVYRLRRTIESVDTIRKSLSKNQVFSTILSKRKQVDGLTSLKKVFNMMFQMMIQKEYRAELYSGFKTELINPENIRKRQDEMQSYVYPEIIQNYNYRNYFFYAFYSPKMKIKVADSEQTLYYNYLDFEVIKQEFLIDWLVNKVGESEQKDEIYAKYSMEGKTLLEAVKENPKKESEVLLQLPLAVFNDVAAQVNSVAKKEVKTEVEPQSENHGEYSVFAREFEKAQQFARESFRKLKLKLKGGDKNDERKVIPSKDLEVKPEEVESTFEFHDVSEEQIDNPFIGKVGDTGRSMTAALRSRMGPTYRDFNKELGDRFKVIPETATISRRSPGHEIIYPKIITETKGKKIINHLLILGAEVKSQQLSMSVSTTGMQQPAHTYTCFLLYGSDKPNSSLGTAIEARTANGIRFQMYDILQPETRSKALMFYNLIKDEIPTAE